MQPASAVVVDAPGSTTLIEFRDAHQARIVGCGLGKPGRQAQRDMAIAGVGTDGQLQQPHVLDEFVVGSKLGQWDCALGRLGSPGLPELAGVHIDERLPDGTGGRAVVLNPYTGSAFDGRPPVTRVGGSHTSDRTTSLGARAALVHKVQPNAVQPNSGLSGNRRRPGSRPE
jgi:hypothetical protein